jgi:hypothetical protein
MADQDVAGTPLCERYAVADVDSHIIEPADLWTSLAGISDEIAGKVLQHTATKLYHLEPPDRS